jgi:hypothetical protein
MKTDVHLWYLAALFLERELWQTKIVEKINTHIFCSITPPPPRICSWRLGALGVEYGRGRQSTVDIIWCLRFACRTTKQKYTHALIIFNTYCFPTVTMVMRKRPNVPLCVHRLVLLMNTLRDGTDDRSACWIESTCTRDTRKLSWPHDEVNDEWSSTSLPAYFLRALKTSLNP